MAATPVQIPASWSNRLFGVALRSSDVAHRGSIVDGSDCGAIKPLSPDAVHVASSFHVERCARCTSRPGEPPMTAPYFDFMCSRCKQFAVPGATVRDQPADQPLACETCRAADRAPQGETVKLFEPSPAQLPGQLSL
jgi:hypothetical protein